MTVTDVDSEFPSRRDKALTKPKRIISASVTIFAMSEHRYGHRFPLMASSRCVWPNGSTMRPASSGRTSHSARRCSFRGNSSRRLRKFRRSFELFDPNMQFPDWLGAHPGVLCQFWLALTSWMLGHPDRSLVLYLAAFKETGTMI
jgi:hypothetical protein